jgi:hypothetical protein
MQEGREAGAKAREETRSAVRRHQLALALQVGGGAFHGAGAIATDFDWRVTDACDGPGGEHRQAHDGGNHEILGDGANGLLLHDDPFRRCFYGAQRDCSAMGEGRFKEIA